MLSLVVRRHRCVCVCYRSVVDRRSCERAFVTMSLDTEQQWTDLEDSDEAYTPTLQQTEHMRCLLRVSRHQESVLHTVGGQSLAPGRFEKWLDRIIGDKLQVRQLQPLATPFEASRPRARQGVRSGRRVQTQEEGWV